jgi:hypothetical protein
VPVADTPDLVHVVVPADPNELGEADLGRVAGGTLVAAESDSTQVDTTRQWRSRSSHLQSFDDNG